MSKGLQHKLDLKISDACEELGKDIDEAIAKKFVTPDVTKKTIALSMKLDASNTLERAAEDVLTRLETFARQISEQKGKIIKIRSDNDASKTTLRLTMRSLENTDSHNLIVLLEQLKEKVKSIHETAIEEEKIAASLEDMLSKLKVTVKKAKKDI